MAPTHVLGKSSVIEQATLKGVRVLVYGNEPSIEFHHVVKALDMLGEHGEIIEEVVHDRTSNVAKYAAAWAEVNGAMQVVFPSLWGQSQQNKIARLLATKPDFIVLFSDGQSDNDMLQQADRLDIRLWQPHI